MCSSVLASTVKLEADLTERLVEHGCLQHLSLLSLHVRAFIAELSPEPVDLVSCIIIFSIVEL
jgi:hypothetical protein